MAEPLRLPIEQFRFNADGLIPAIAQDWLDGAVLMVAWMNRQALELTLSTREVHYCCLLYTSPSPRDRQKSRIPSSA